MKDIYVGMVKIDGKWTQGMHKSIITKEMFEKEEKVERRRNKNV